MKSGLVFEERDAMASLETVERLWCQLEARTPQASPFVRWPWVSAWLSVYGPALRPSLVTGRRGKDLIGAVLLSPQRVRRRQVFWVRQLSINTCGEPEDESVTVEYNHLLAPDADRAAFAQGLLDHLLASPAWSDRWDELLFTGFAPEQVVSTPPRTGWRLEVLSRRPCYAMDLRPLRDEGKAPEQVISANTRHQINRSLRLYGGRKELRLTAARDGQEGLAFLEEMAALHQASWQDRGKPGVFGSERFMRFHRRYVSEGCPGRAQLLRLCDGQGQAIGISYNLLDQDVVYFYQSGLRAEEDARKKPGLCLHLLAMEQALRDGRVRYDFMASDARYKRSLSNSERVLLWAALQRPRARLLLERAAVRAVREAKHLRNTYRSRRAAKVPHPEPAKEPAKEEGPQEAATV